MPCVTPQDSFILELEAATCCPFHPIPSPPLLVTTELISSFPKRCPLKISVFTAGHDSINGSVTLVNF